MIIDASVWIAGFRGNDAHHPEAAAFLETAVAKLQDLDIPNFALAEIAGVFARQTGNARLAARTVRAVLALPGVLRHELSDPLADRAAALAARSKLRGAEAVYVALAEVLETPLITLDRQILDRSKRIVRALTPAGWLRNNP